MFILARPHPRPAEKAAAPLLQSAAIRGTRWPVDQALELDPFLYRNAAMFGARDPWLQATSLLDGVTVRGALRPADSAVESKRRSIVVGRDQPDSPGSSCPGDLFDCLERTPIPSRGWQAISTTISSWSSTGR
jgi:hypothetical protein